MIVNDDRTITMRRYAELRSIWHAMRFGRTIVITTIVCLNSKNTNTIVWKWRLINSISNSRLIRFLFVSIVPYFDCYDDSFVYYKYIHKKCLSTVCCCVVGIYYLLGCSRCEFWLDINVNYSKKHNTFQMKSNRSLRLLIISCLLFSQFTGLTHSFIVFPKLIARTSFSQSKNWTIPAIELKLQKHCELISVASAVQLIALSGCFVSKFFEYFSIFWRKLWNIIFFFYFDILMEKSMSHP